MSDDRHYQTRSSDPASGSDYEFYVIGFAHLTGIECLRDFIFAFHSDTPAANDPVVEYAERVREDSRIQLMSDLQEAETTGLTSWTSEASSAHHIQTCLRNTAAHFDLAYHIPAHHRVLASVARMFPNEPTAAARFLNAGLTRRANRSFLTKDHILRGRKRYPAEMYRWLQTRHFGPGQSGIAFDAMRIADQGLMSALLEVREDARRHKDLRGLAGAHLIEAIDRRWGIRPTVFKVANRRDALEGVPLKTITSLSLTFIQPPLAQLSAP